jgi:hypothetical protein
MLGSARNASQVIKIPMYFRLFIQIIIQTDYLTVSPGWKSREIGDLISHLIRLFLQLLTKDKPFMGTAFFNNTAEIILLLQEVKTRNLKDIMETQRGNLIL